jgi:hypothetical protein
MEGVTVTMPVTLYDRLRRADRALQEIRDMSNSEPPASLEAIHDLAKKAQSGIFYPRLPE